jgi:hypothetical protein
VFATTNDDTAGGLTKLCVKNNVDDHVQARDRSSAWQNNA